MNNLKQSLLGNSDHALYPRPWVKKLVQYSFLFFVGKGVLWTALAVFPLIMGMQSLWPN